MVVIQYKKGNLFTSPEALAHCVSSDFHMSAGIASVFRNRFGGQSELLEKGYQVGHTAKLEREGRLIFYLVTKWRYYHKPTYQTLEWSLVELAKWCEVLNISHLSIPKLGCGLDGLKWDKVENLITRVFEGLEVTITVYSL